MTKLPKGPLKIIAPNITHALANRQRSGSGGTRFKPVWRVFVLNAADQTFTSYEALTFRASGLTPRHDPRGIRHEHPTVNSAMRRALNAGLWFETRSEITLDDDVVATTPAETAEIRAAALTHTAGMTDAPNYEEK